MPLTPFDLYLAQLTRPAAARAVVALGRVAAFLTGGAAAPAGLPWQSLTPESAASVRLWATYCHPATTANQMLTALRGVIRWSVRAGEMTAEDGSAVSRALGRARSGPATRLGIGRPLARRGILALLDVCERDETPLGARDAALVSLMAAGLTAAEAARLRWPDFDRDRGLVLVRTPSGRPGRALLIAATPAEQALTLWTSVAAAIDGPVFSSLPSGRGLSAAAIGAIVRRRAFKAGAGNLTPAGLSSAYRWELGRLSGREPNRPPCSLLNLDDGSLWLLTPPLPSDRESGATRQAG
jgi:integrase